MESILMGLNVLYRGEIMYLGVKTVGEKDLFLAKIIFML